MVFGAPGAVGPPVHPLADRTELKSASVIATIRHPLTEARTVQTSAEAREEPATTVPVLCTLTLKISRERFES